MTTIVSGFWFVKNKYDKKYLSWFNNSLRINMPYVFFGSKEVIEIVKDIRSDLPTYYIELEISDLETYKYKEYIQTHETHVPSVELSLIWLNKVFLVKRAAEINPFKSEMFGWIDAGICEFRNKKPPEVEMSKDILSKLPLDRFIFCSTEYSYFIPDLVDDHNYYHYISGNFFISVYMIGMISQVYSEFLDKKLPKRELCFSSEQVIFTHMYKCFGDNMFYKFSDGYGSIVTNMYKV